MQPNRATKRADCHEAAGAAKYDGEASDKPGQSQSMRGRSHYEVSPRRPQRAVPTSEQMRHYLRQDKLSNRRAKFEAIGASFPMGNLLQPERFSFPASMLASRDRC